MKTMKNFIYNTMIAATAVMVVSCGDSSIPDYNGDYTAVRFAGVSPDPDYGNNSGGVTYYNFSFVDEPEADTYLYDIPVYLTGRDLDADTRVSYEIDIDNTTAPAGSYEVVGAMIPAGKRNGAITVRLVKTDELQGEVTYTLALRLLSSDELMTGDSRYLNSRVTWSNNLPLPTNTQHIRSYNMLIAGHPTATSTASTYMSTNGLMAIVAAMDWNDWDDPVAHPGQYNNAAYGNYKYLPRYSYIYLNNIYMVYSRMVGEWLDKYEKQHGAPLLHNGGLLDGQPVKARYN